MSNFLNLPKDKAGAIAGGAAAGAVAGNLRDRAGERPDARPVGRPADRQANRGEWKNNRDQISNDYRQNRDQIADRRHDRGANIRDHVNDHYYHHPGGQWNNWYGNCWHHNPVWPWWNVSRPLRWAAWGSLASWCGGGTYYVEPMYYDYGYTSTGESVVYVDSNPVANVDDYAASAEELAATGAETIDTAIADNTAAEMEWLPLGVYAMTDEEDGDPIMFVQLAVAKDGTLGGTYYNALTEEETEVQGSVDQETQRAAFSIGENSKTVIETGIYNLTQEETTALVHFGDGKTQTWFMVRMPDPETADAAPTDGNSSTGQTPEEP